MIKNLYEDAIAESVRGDLQAFSRLVESGMPVDASHDMSPSDLVLTKNEVLSVLRSFKWWDVPESLVQQWASFMRRGYYGAATGPRRRLHIEYEPSAEDEIVEIIGRLDELGDEIDGKIPDDELDQMIATLTG